MAKQPETTRHAAVWNPPRIRKLNLHDVESGTRPSTSQWEGTTNHLPNAAPPAFSAPSRGYRMPTSGEPVPYPYPWQ